MCITIIIITITTIITTARRHREEGTLAASGAGARAIGHEGRVPAPMVATPAAGATGAKTSKAEQRRPWNGLLLGTRAVKGLLVAATSIGIGDEKGRKSCDEAVSKTGGINIITGITTTTTPIAFTASSRTISSQPREEETTRSSIMGTAGERRINSRSALLRGREEVEVEEEATHATAEPAPAGTCLVTSGRSSTRGTGGTSGITIR